MTWFRVVDIWFERIDGKTAARVRFQKLDLEQLSWWASKKSDEPVPVNERRWFQPRSQICRVCSYPSKLIYQEGWMCLQPNCSAFWRLEAGHSPGNLTYDAKFLEFREPPDDRIQPEVSLVPEILKDLYSNPDACTQRLAWRGVVCPKCHKCVSRRYWNGWVCHEPLDDRSAHPDTCQWKMMVNMPLISLRSVIAEQEIGVIKRAIRIDDQSIQPESRLTRPFQIFRYNIENVGMIVHFSANKTTLRGLNGPNELFERLQKVDLGLRRYPLKQCVGQSMGSKFLSID